MKKVISLLLVMALLFSVLAVSFNALSVSDVDEDTGEALVPSFKDGIAAYEEEEGMEPDTLGTQRVYFQMPNGKTGPTADEDVYVHVPEELDPDTGEVISEAHDDLVLKKGDKAKSWYNAYNIYNGKHYPGVYWWGGPAAVEGKWVGYRMEIADEKQGIFYVDIPYDSDDTTLSVAVAIFNNGVDGGTDSSQPIYYNAAQSKDQNVEGAFAGDYDSIPEGSPDEWSFDGCIFIVDPNQSEINPFSQMQTCGVLPYVYYGNGCYGHYFEGCDEYTGDVTKDCCNPDHFKNGVHVGYQDNPDQPTEAHIHTPGVPVKENEVPATCTAPGTYDEVVKCAECGEELSRTQKTTVQLPHTAKFKPGKKATETADGWKSYFYCTECGKYFSNASCETELTWDQIVIHYVAPTEPAPTPTEPAPEPTEPPITGFIGDIDGNGEIDIIDVTVGQRILAQVIPGDKAMKARGDVDKSGAFEVTDVTRLQRWLLGGLETDSKIGEKV